MLTYNGTHPLQLLRHQSKRSTAIALGDSRHPRTYWTSMQVVGYDSRRRMHRCAYDVTGEKQWHDLANKRFEVVGQNGAIVRSTESAPPAPPPTRPTTTNSSSAPPLLLLPTFPDTTPLDASSGGSGGSDDNDGR